jgi:hypothetical protein
MAVKLPHPSRWPAILLILLIGTILLAYSTVPPGDQLERVRAFTRAIEFNYLDWTLGALGGKLNDLALGTQSYLPDENVDRQLVLDYLALVTEIQSAEGRLNDIYADPQIPNPDMASSLVRDQLDKLYARREQLAPLAEAVFQDQLSATVAGLGLTYGGQPLPPVLYRTTPLPTALIVSPRDVIRQDQNISLTPEMNAADRAASKTALTTPWMSPPWSLMSVASGSTQPW